MTGRRKASIAAAIAVVAAALAGWYRPVPGDVPADAVPAETWRLPSAATLDRTNVELASQARGLAWPGAGGAAGGASPEGGAVSWTLRGVVLDAGVPAALVQAESGPGVVRVERGGTLPDGARLVAVERGAVVYESEGCRQRRTVYPIGEDGSTDPDTACGAPQGNKEPSSP